MCVSVDSVSAFNKIAFQVYSWLVIVPILVICTAVVCSFIFILSMLGLPDFAGRVFGTAWARINLAAMLSGVTIEGGEKVIKNQPYVITANHQSLIDIYVLYGYLGMDIKWVMKQELKKVPMLGITCEKMGHILIDRSNTHAALESINSARSRILRGNSVIFFPEGTRSRDGNLLPFKKGAFRLAAELKLPILPISIQGTKDVLPSDTMVWKPGSIRMRILDPISADEVAKKDARSLAAQTKAVIEAAL